MKTPVLSTGLNPFDDPLDRLLAEIAFSIQLPPSLHEKAVTRYEAIRAHLESSKYPFANQIEHFYPQGSMAIDATISTRGTDDDFDLDIVAQLGGSFRERFPLETLKELERILSEYRDVEIVRQTRCVTIYYKDSMHLDVTPAFRHPTSPERQGHILHAKGPNRSSDDRLVPMNAFGFANWYALKTPLEQRVFQEFSKRWFDREGLALNAEANVDDVPDQTKFVVKNTATLALQLLKRFRNIQYVNYLGRIPPSILLSYYAANAATPNMRLSDMVLRIANQLIADIEYATSYGRKLHVVNPTYSDDVFTDRWPESIPQQKEFVGHLKILVNGIDLIRNGGMSADDMTTWLRIKFGDRVVTAAADRIAAELGRNIERGNVSYTRRGGLVIPSLAAVGGATTSLIANPALGQARPHTFFGKKI